MAKVVTDGATFTCPHTGTAKIIVATTKFTVSGVNVLTTADIIGSAIGGAGETPCTWTGGANVPCTAIFALVSGGATKLTKDSLVVSLNTDSYSTNGNGGTPPLITIAETQTKLTAI